VHHVVVNVDKHEARLCDDAAQFTAKEGAEVVLGDVRGVFCHELQDLWWEPSSSRHGSSGTSRSSNNKNTSECLHRSKVRYTKNLEFEKPFDIELSKHTQNCQLPQQQHALIWLSRHNSGRSLTRSGVSLGVAVVREPPTTPSEGFGLKPGIGSVLCIPIGMWPAFAMQRRPRRLV
jgi:hypothetical protein